MLHGDPGHPSGADDDDVPSSEVAERVGREVGPQRHERVRRGAERCLGACATARPRGRVEQRARRGTRCPLGLGRAQRLADLRVDLRLADHHGVQPRGHTEEMVGRVLLPVRVERFGQFLRGDPARLGQDPLQPQEPGVVRGDVRVDLDSVAGGQDHRLVDGLHVERVAISLDQVAVGE